MSWPRPAEPAARLTLAFDNGPDDAPPDNASAGARYRDDLFVAGDEFSAVERFTIDGLSAGGHRAFAVAGLLPLRDPESEIDIEGLAAVDDGGPWLWIVGSHARTRRKAEKSGGVIDLEKLADLKASRGRCLLARVPLAADGAGWAPVATDGDRRAAMLPQDKGGNALMAWMRANPLLAPFAELPAKEGGIDVEGVAVAPGEGAARVALGMRGPVVGGHAMLIELALACEDDALRIAAEPVVRLVALDGLGIRDLKLVGDDLLILAGPTTSLSGPVAVHRWAGWRQDPPRDPARVRVHRPERVLRLPFGRGEDHPEGIVQWTDGRLLVIHDSPSAARLDREAKRLTVDLFDLP